MRVGLVLGAGGSAGIAYHGAVLATLEEMTGWDPRTAEVIVGTSAGSLTGALLRAGLPAADLRRISEGEELSPEGARLAEIGRPHRPHPRAADFVTMRPFADPVGALRGLTRLGRESPVALLAALMPAGRVPTDAISEGINAVFDGRWPDESLWLCAVGLRDGKRVVFGKQGSPRAPVGDAVAASCAIPGYFTPVVVDGRRYVDGGVHSMVNLDLLAGAGLDLVVVSSPMSRASAFPGLAADTLVRHAMRSRLHREISALRRTGVQVVAIEPGRSVMASMGLNPMDARCRGPVSKSTHRSLSRWLGHSDDGRRLAEILSGAAGTPASDPPSVRNPRSGRRPRVA